MYSFRCVTSDVNPNTWDIRDQDDRLYCWGGDLSGALREADRLEHLANGKARVCPEHGDQHGARRCWTCNRPLEWVSAEK